MVRRRGLRQRSQLMTGVRRKKTMPTVMPMSTAAIPTPNAEIKSRPVDHLAESNRAEQQEQG